MQMLLGKGVPVECDEGCKGIYNDAEWEYAKGDGAENERTRKRKKKRTRTQREKRRGETKSRSEKEKKEKVSQPTRTLCLMYRPCMLHSVPV